MSGKMREETLDLENWDEIRALGNRMLDDIFDLHQNIRSFKINPFPTKYAVNAIQVPLTEEGEGEEKVYQVFTENILPHVVGNALPRAQSI